MESTDYGDAPARTPTGTNVLSVRDLSISFLTHAGPKRVLNDISFDIGEGETLAIVGESGSGKSVTALAVMGLHPDGKVEKSGRIELLGRDLMHLPEAEMRRIRGNEIAMIFQEPMSSLNPVMTIERQLIEALVIHRRLETGLARREALALLEKVRIPSARSRLSDYPHNLSGGMRQRVMIAMALACRPRLLIADEPTTALDVTIQAQIIDLIKMLQEEENMAVMFITHDMGVVAEIADRTLVMYRGEAVETGPTPRIFHQPAELYTKSLLAAVPRLGAMADSPDPAYFPVIDPDTGVAEPAISNPPRPDRRTVLEVRNLTTRFSITKGLLGRVHGRVHAVENVSFSLAEAETLSLVGESGCGKSTTGRSIMRLVQPQSGSVVLDGVDLMAQSSTGLRRQRQNIQMIFQDPFSSLNPRMRIGEAIAEPLITNGLAMPRAARARAARLLEDVGLQPDMMERYPHEFSGGQRQRICIARAMSLEPKVIVADESVSALDVSVKAQVVNLMMHLQRRLGIAIIFISHDMSVVERISHRVAVMFLGEIVEIGSRQAVFSNPRHPYTRRLLSAVPVPDPSRLRARHGIAELEIRTAIRPPDYEVRPRRYIEVGDDHMVLDWQDDEDWMRIAG